jgi:hypothetical protein
MDNVFKTYLAETLKTAEQLQAQSDILELAPLSVGGRLPQQYLARFCCRGLVRDAGGRVVPGEGPFDVGITFPDHYLRGGVKPWDVLSWLAPANVFHPNIMPPAVCVGEQFFDTHPTLLEICYQLYALISYGKWASHHGLNEPACQWARNHQDLFPTDPRPLKRRAVPIEVELVKGG